MGDCVRGLREREGAGIVVGKGSIETSEYTNAGREGVMNSGRSYNI